MTITNGYATLAALKNEIGISDNSDDTRLEAAITAASRQIDAHCGRRFWQDTTVQAVEFDTDEAWTFEPPGEFDISTSTGLIVKVDTGDDGTYETTLTIDTDFVLIRPLGKPSSWPYTEIRLTSSPAATFPTSSRRPALQITAKFGWAAVPTEVAQACLIQAKNLWKATSGTFSGFQLASAEAGVAFRIPGMDWVAGALLERYRKGWCG